MTDDRPARPLGLLSVWRLAFALTVLVLALMAAEVGGRSRQIYAEPGTDRAAATAAANPLRP
jgi:hypothetical protein